MSFSGNDRVRATLQHVAGLVATSQAAHALAQKQAEQRLLRHELQSAARVRADILHAIETLLDTRRGVAHIGPTGQGITALLDEAERADGKVMSGFNALSQMVVPLSVDEVVRHSRDRLERSVRRLQACLRLVRVKHQNTDASGRGVVLLAGFDETRTMDLACELAERGFDAEVAGGIGEALCRIVWQSPVAVAVPEGAQAAVNDALESVAVEDLPLLVGVTKDADAAQVAQSMFTHSRLYANAPTVLVVEDDADLRSALALALSERGFSVKEAMDGRDALAQLENGSSAVVLLDLMMPRMSGVSFLKEVAKSDSPPRVVVYSAYVEPAAQAFANVTAVLRKTAGIDAVVTALRNSLA